MRFRLGHKLLNAPFSVHPVSYKRGRTERWDSFARSSRPLPPVPRHERTDIHLWVAKNAPCAVQELQDLRYTLYHRCSRAEFKVSQKQDKDIFVLSGRQSPLQIVSNKARRYLLWRLRILAREEGWVRRTRRRIRFVALGLNSGR